MPYVRKTRDCAEYIVQGHYQMEGHMNAQRKTGRFELPATVGDVDVIVRGTFEAGYVRQIESAKSEPDDDPRADDPASEDGR